MNFRTDLALERQEYIDKKEIDGVRSSRKEVDGVTVHTIVIENAQGEKIIGKPKGRYITVETKPFTKSADLLSSSLTAVAEELKSLLPEKGTVLVAGLGNEKITPDALGPKCISLLLATRHIDAELAKSIGFENLRSVAGIVPGVLGKTGIETAEIIGGIVNKIRPSAVIVIDALASRNLERLGKTVQICDTGISPGSGVGNSRGKINADTLGVPVIGIGVPTVVDAATMVFDILEKSGLSHIEPEQEKEILSNRAMMVTPKEIDNVIDRAAHLIAMAINSALQPDVPCEDILSIVS